MRATQFVRRGLIAFRDGTNDRILGPTQDELVHTAAAPPNVAEVETPTDVETPTSTEAGA